MSASRGGVDRSWSWPRRWWSLATALPLRSPFAVVALLLAGYRYSAGVRKYRACADLAVTASDPQQVGGEPAAVDQARTLPGCDACLILAAVQAREPAQAGAR